MYMLRYPNYDKGFQRLDDQMQGQKNDPPMSPSGPYLRGPGGLFNRLEMDNQVFSAFLSPMGGVANNLPVFNSSVEIGGEEFGGEDAVFDTLLTGVTEGDVEDFSNQPSGACEDGPEGGLLKMGSIVNPFGNYKASTREVQIYRAGRVANRLDALTLQLMNAPNMQSLLGVPNSNPSLANAVANEMASRIYTMFFSFYRMLSRRTWIGSPANNNGEARDIVGLDIHINENNKRDARSGAILAAANSTMGNFGFNEVGSTTQDIVRLIEWTDHVNMFKASRMGLGQVDGFMALHPNLAYRITEVWPVRQFQAALTQMGNFQNGRVVVDATEAQELRDGFRSRRVLPVNGRLLRYVEDDTIFEHNSTNTDLPAGRFASDIYYVPVSVLGGVPVSYWQYFNHANSMSAAIERFAGAQTFTTDGGMFRWYVNHKNGCLKLNVQFTPRLRVRTPQIAWRIQDVAYDNLGHVPDWDPNSPYFANGGETAGETPAYYSSWGESPVTL